MQKLSRFDRKVIIFYTMLTNAYLEAEDRTPPMEVLKLLREGGDLTEDFVAMVAAIRIFAEKVAPDDFKDKDFIDFTYTINRLVVQHVHNENEYQCESLPEADDLEEE